MAARRVDLIIPDERVAEALELISTYSRRSWREVVEGGLEKISCIVQPRRVEALLSDLEGQFGTVSGFLVPQAFHGWPTGTATRQRWRRVIRAGGIVSDVCPEQPIF